MEDRPIVRMIKSELTNIKNVRHGKVEYMNYSSVQKKGELLHSDIVGLYGQNGSGKSALVEALDMLKYILSETPIPYEPFSGLISADDRELASLSTTFFAQVGRAKFKVVYFVTLKPNYEDKSIELREEKLTYWDMGSTWKAERDLYFENPYYDSEELFHDENVVIQSKHMRAFKQVRHLRNMQVLAATCAQSHTSVFFDKKGIKTIENIPNIELEAKKLFIVISALRIFATQDFHVITVSQLADINNNMLIPLNTHYEKGSSVVQGCIPLFTNGQGEIPAELYEVFVGTIRSINIAIKAIIPNLQIEMEKANEIKNEDGSTSFQVEVYSVRDGKRFLTRYESEGIKRLISIISYLVSVYNEPSVCLVVDELDSGIFEYLLGELLGVLYEEMKGQLIFTSHNLRVLEKLDYKNIICSTTNPENRYITLTGVGANNNTRNFYIRSLIIGGQSETLYDDTELDAIGYAFRRAGHPEKKLPELNFSDEIKKMLEKQAIGSADQEDQS